MAITINSVICPECKASLPIEEGRTQVYCSYCGASVIVTNENEHIYRHIDEADVKQAETDRMVRLRELDMDEQLAEENSTFRKIIMIIWLILSLIILVICIIRCGIMDDFSSGIITLFYLGGPVIGGGAYLIFKVMPEKERNKRLSRNGGIRFPQGININDADTNYETVLASLTSAGFNNISCVNMHDLKLGILKRPGSIESITINGERTTSAGKIYMPDVPIVITYHGR